MLFRKKKKVSLSLEKKVSLLVKMEQAKDTKLKIITADFVEQLNIPDKWKNLLSCENTQTKIENVIKLWELEMAKKLPSIVNFFEKYLVDVDLILTPDAFKVLYYCMVNDTVYCFEGGVPIREAKIDEIDIIPDTIKNFYNDFHNGFDIQGFGIVPFEKSSLIDSISLNLNKCYSFFTDRKGTFIGVDLLNGNTFEYNSNSDLEYYADFWERVNNYFSVNFM